MKVDWIGCGHIHSTSNPPAFIPLIELVYASLDLGPLWNVNGLSPFSNELLSIKFPFLLSSFLLGYIPFASGGININSRVDQQQLPLFLIC
jgi:hypothetical protein